MECLRCKKPILDAEYWVIGNRRAVLAATTPECCTSCLNGTTHLPPIEKHLILPRRRRDEPIINVRLEDTRS